MFCLLCGWLSIGCVFSLFVFCVLCVFGICAIVRLIPYEANREAAGRRFADSSCFSISKQIKE